MAGLKPYNVQQEIPLPLNISSMSVYNKTRKWIFVDSEKTKGLKERISFCG